MNDLYAIVDTLRPVGSSIWGAAITAAQGSAFAWALGCLFLGLWLPRQPRTWTGGMVAAAIGVGLAAFVIAAVIRSLVTGGV